MATMQLNQRKRKKTISAKDWRRIFAFSATVPETVYFADWTMNESWTYAEWTWVNAEWNLVNDIWTVNGSKHRTRTERRRER